MARLLVDHPRDDSKTLVQRLLAAVEKHQMGSARADDITITTFRLDEDGAMDEARA